MEASWTEMHPDFVHEVVTDKTALHLVRYLYAAIPEVYEVFEALPMPILQADFFRYLILLARGGIYTDIDTWALQPAVDWLPDNIDQATIGLIIGIEADPDRPDWRDWYSRRVQFCQWTIQSKPGHPILREVVATITEEALRMKRAGILTKSKMDKTVVEFTGPAIWTDIILNYFNDPKYFHIERGQKNVSYEDFTGLKDRKKVGDVAVLPITSFSPGVQQMGAEEPDHPLAFVKHEFGGKHLIPRSLYLLTKTHSHIHIRYVETRKSGFLWMIAIAIISPRRPTVNIIPPFSSRRVHFILALGEAYSNYDIMRLFAFIYF